MIPSADARGADGEIWIGGSLRAADSSAQKIAQAITPEGTSAHYGIEALTSRFVWGDS